MFWGMNMILSMYRSIIIDINIARLERVQVGHHSLRPAGVEEEGDEHRQGLGLRQGLGAGPQLHPDHTELLKDEVGSVQEDVPVHGQLRVTWLQLLGPIDAGLLLPV